MTKHKSPIDQTQINELYEWIKKIINSCEKLIHIQPCYELIDIFERRSPPEYLVKALKELVKIHEASLMKSKKKADKIPVEDRIYELFNSGHSPIEITQILNQKYHVVLDVIDKKRKTSKKKSGH